MRLQLNSFITAALLCTSLSAFSSEDELNQELESFALQQRNCQFAGTFQQVKQLDGLDEGLTSSGVFYHHCERGVIWSTLTPVLETLVMRRDGKGFIITDTDQKQLKSRQGKFLSSLLNSLMSGDQGAIEKQFELAKLSSGAIKLTPKKRTLKRAIKAIEVSRSSDNKNVGIAILDRNLQKTHISSNQTQLFDIETTADNVALNCRSAMAGRLSPQTAAADSLLVAESSSAQTDPSKLSGCAQLLYTDKNSQR
jgi:hypothetical protein